VEKMHFLVIKKNFSLRRYKIALTAFEKNLDE
jgi:hypothetical protein